jgi:hypothetical protein
MTGQDEQERRDRWQALGIRTDVAHPARVYDYLLGGKDNFAADSANRWGCCSSPACTTSPTPTTPTTPPASSPAT